MPSETVVLIDSGPLGKLVNPEQHPEVKDWLAFMKKRKILIRVPQICDYELRRELILQNFTKSIGRLDRFQQQNQFLPLSEDDFFEAAEIWAGLRKTGQPTSDDRGLDGDVILAAQAISQQQEFEQVIILTENERHIPRFQPWGIHTWLWKQAIVDCRYGEINLYQ